MRETAARLFGSRNKDAANNGFQAVTNGTTYYSRPFRPDYEFGPEFSFHNFWTTGTAGTFALQVTNDESVIAILDKEYNPLTDGPIVWDTLTLPFKLNPSGVAANSFEQFAQAKPVAVRLRFICTGTGTIKTLAF